MRSRLNVKSGNKEQKLVGEVVERYVPRLNAHEYSLQIPELQESADQHGLTFVACDPLPRPTIVSSRTGARSSNLESAWRGFINGYGDGPQDELKRVQNVYPRGRHCRRAMFVHRYI